MVLSKQNKKVIVYVKHYLTPDGIAYFLQEWFPLVHSLISQQKGFVFITHHIRGPCANISLQFEDETTFDAWIAHPSHGSLIDALDSYRDRDYWEFARTNNPMTDPSHLEWTRIERAE